MRDNNPPMTEFGRILALLLDAGVEFVVVGGVAGNALGAPRTTLDLDIVYQRTDANIERMVKALATVHPYLRGAPPGLPFKFDVATVKRGLNFTLTIDLGWLDLLGEIVGGGKYEDLLPHSTMANAWGRTFRCLKLEKLIEVKRAAGRPKDFEAIAELEGILNRSKQN